MTVPGRQIPRLSLAAVRDNLNRIGYDIEPAQPGDPPYSSVVARREQGDRAIVVAIDAGGRIRVTISRTVEEWSQSLTVSGFPVRAVETLSSTLNLTGQVATQDDANQFVAALADLELPLPQSGALPDC